MSEPDEPRAWGWVAHLRDGGVTPWAEWSGRAETAGRFIPGAQQLELLRRLNAAGRPEPALVERVVTASAPGRGSPDLELVGAAPVRSFGPRPVDPTQISDDALLRVATSLLAEDVVAAGAPEPAAPSRPRPWRRPYRLVGVPWLADPLRAELRRRGRPPGGKRPVVVVLGSDLETMVSAAFASRAFGEGVNPWPEFVAGLVAHRDLPPRADLEVMARRWARTAGPRRLRVVLDPATVPAQIGTRLRLAPPPVVAADGVELARRVGAPLALLVVPDRRKQLLRHGLLPRLVAAAATTSGLGAMPLAVPEQHRPWLEERAARMRDALLAAGYPVVGDPDRLVPVATRSGTQPAPSRVLDLALRLLLEETGR